MEVLKHYNQIKLNPRHFEMPPKDKYVKENKFAEYSQYIKSIMFNFIFLKKMKLC